MDPIGLGQTAGLDSTGGAYYFVGVPLGSDGMLFIMLSFPCCNINFVSNWISVK